MEHALLHPILERFRWWGNRPLLLLSCTFSCVALVLAAIDQIPTMIQVWYVALLFFAGHTVVFAYLHLPLEERRSSFSRRFIRRAAASAFVSAVVVGSFYWFVGWTPNAYTYLPRFVVHHFIKLDYIPSAFALLLPIEWRSGFHQYFRYGTYCFPGGFWWESTRYLRTAIPAYALVLFLFTSGVRLLNATVRGWRS